MKQLLLILCVCAFLVGCGSQAGPVVAPENAKPPAAMSAPNKDTKAGSSMPAPSTAPDPTK